MDTQIKENISKRGYAKAAITRAEKYYNECLTATEYSCELLETLRQRRKRLIDAFNDYNTYCLKVKMLCKDDDEDPGEIENTYINLLARFNILIDEISTSTSKANNNSCDVSNCNIKLPNIVIPTFTGKYTEYYEFFNMFDSVIGSDATKPAIQKLYYLKTFLADEPLALVSGLPLTDSSYAEAIRLLKERYDNKFKIINEHINMLLNQPTIIKSTPSALREFISHTKQELAALQNLGEPVETWDSIIICILCKKLDLITSRAYHLERDTNKKPTIKDFLMFLEQRALALENIDCTFSKGRQMSSNTVVSSPNEERKEEQSCLYCKYKHKLYVCPSFKLAPIDKRIMFVTQKKLCRLCLNAHANKKCRFHFKCNICKQHHHTLLHTHEHKVSEAPPVTLMSGASNGNVLLPTARVKLISKAGTIITCRALLDSGSQTCFITQRLANLLGYNTKLAKCNIIGIANTEKLITHSLNVEIHSLVYPFKLNVNCHVVSQITTKLPQQMFDISHLKIKNSYKLADEGFNKPGDVHLLLGADIFFQILLPQHADEDVAACRNSEQPRLLNTSLGYIVAGQVPSQNHISKYVSLFCKKCDNDINESLSKFWKTEQVCEVYPEKLPELEYTEQLFKNTVSLNNYKFQVTLPLKLPLCQINKELGDSFHLALSRFINLEKRFLKDKQLFACYKKFIDQYVELGHGKYININQYDLSKDPVYFLPTHPVIREDKLTTSFRVVFDGSMKTNKKVSLNDMLLKGPVVQKDLFDILISFRLDKYFIITDIKMMFRFIDLVEDQKSLQNILWRENPNEDIKCIQLQTVTYGLKTSSYVATRCLIELAIRFKDQFPLASCILRHNTYVDDILATHESREGLINMQKELTQILSQGGFQLHKWSSNCEEVIDLIPKDQQFFGELNLQKSDMSIKTLGVNFDVGKDAFKLHTTQPCTVTQYTKREILRYISKFFDPLGLMGPIFVQAKLILQSLWAANKGWDDTLPDSIRVQWEEFFISLSKMEPIYVPRCIIMTTSPMVQLIGFADSSIIAHGCCLYLRVISIDGKVNMHLLCSKSRINSHNNKLTIPRLELNACLLLIKLSNKILITLRLKMSIQHTQLFTDSQIALSWINSDIAKLNTYVANRVRIIQDLSSQDCCQWGYVDTNDNPADCISRGLLPHNLKDHKLWWIGPSVFHNKDIILTKVYREPNVPKFSSLDGETSEPLVCTLATDKFESNCILQNIIDKYSNIGTIVRVLAYIIRFCNNLRASSIKNKQSFLSVQELNDALLLLIKFKQQKYFGKEIKCIKSGQQYTGSLKPLHPFIGHDEILRVGGRLQNSMLPYSKKHLIILPKSSTLTQLIIKCEHYKLLHAGQKLVLSSLNQKYWIIDGLRSVKKILHKCITCFRLKAAAARQLMGSLPPDRLKISRAFSNIGLDFAGPVLVKQSRIRKAVIGKGYILVIVCFATKAIHLELASDMTTDTFLACFKRFVARRNLPSNVYCDNQSTFKAARTRLGDLYRLYGDKDHQLQVQSYASDKGVRFHFIPSYSPIFGGLWESSVKSVKHHLKLVMGRALLTYEQINTVLTEIEAVLNSRPLGAMSADPTDFSYLTPGHFLTGAPLNSYPEQDVTDTPTNLLKFWSICTNMKQVFWKYWSKVYLTTLQNRPKWRSVMANVSVDALVILREQNVPPLYWPMARVTKVFPGTDGLVRAVEVKTSNGHSHRRSITKVCILPLDNT